MYKAGATILIPITTLLVVSVGFLKMQWIDNEINMKQSVAIIQLQEVVQDMPDACTLEVVICPDEKQETVPELITRLAVAADFDVDTALRLAKCESTYRLDAKNSQSSATGLYQFTTGTWQWIGAEAAGMDRTNPEHATAMFIKYYPRYPHWWKCQ